MAGLTGIAQIQIRATQIIKGIAPEVSPTWGFEPVESGPLEDQAFGDRKAGTRRFQVIVGPLAGVRGVMGGKWLGEGLWHGARDVMAVKVRYDVSFEDGGFTKRNNMIASDQQLLAFWLSPGASSYPLDCRLIGITPSGTVNTKEIEDPNSKKSVIFITFVYELLLNIGA
jgi:hypothetical protein